MLKVKSLKFKVQSYCSLLLAALLFLYPHFSSAQKFTASVNKNRVAVGEAFQVSFSLNTNGGNFSPPSFADFDVYSGPNQSSSMQYINGSMSQSITLSYVIAAKKEGKLTIGSAVIVADGKRLESNPVTVEVVKGAAGQGTQGQQNAGQNPSTRANGEDLFARIFVSKSKAYQGEQISVTYKIYTRLNVVSIQDEGLPDLNSFWFQRLSQTNYNVSQENIDGVGYKVIEVAKVFAFAQRSGTIEIGPVNAKCVVRQRSGRGPQSIFDQFFGGGYEDVFAYAKSRPVKIEILPLPDHGKPADFSGAVGNFSFKATVAKDKIKTNDAINLNLTISGKGNLKFIDPVKINFPDNFEIYDPKTTDNIGISANGVSGSKNFEYLVIPRKEGIYKLEPVNFSYFDPERKTYITLPSPEFNLTIEKGTEKEGAAGAQLITSAAKEEIKQLNTDIRYIKTTGVHFALKGNYFFGSEMFYAGLATPLLAFISFIFLRRRYISYSSNTILVKNRKANKVAKKRLKTAEQHIQAKEKEKFYDEIFRALYGYLSDKLNIPVADLSKEKITHSLKERKLSDNLNQKLISTLDNCEFARYAPAAVSDDLGRIYEDTTDLIAQMEEKL